MGRIYFLVATDLRSPFPDSWPGAAFSPLWLSCPQTWSSPSSRRTAQYQMLLILKSLSDLLSSQSQKTVFRGLDWPTFVIFLPCKVPPSWALCHPNFRRLPRQSSHESRGHCSSFMVATLPECWVRLEILIAAQVWAFELWCWINLLVTPRNCGAVYLWGMNRKSAPSDPDRCSVCPCRVLKIYDIKQCQHKKETNFPFLKQTSFFQKIFGNSRPIPHTVVTFQSAHCCPPLMQC